MPIHSLFSVLYLLLIAIVVLLIRVVSLLKTSNEINNEKLQIAEKTFKLIRYKRSQELLNFLDKRCK